jgi:hypothetical protein
MCMLSTGKIPHLLMFSGTQHRVRATVRQGRFLQRLIGTKGCVLRFLVTASHTPPSPLLLTPEKRTNLYFLRVSSNTIRVIHQPASHCFTSVTLVLVTELNPFTKCTRASSSHRRIKYVEIKVRFAYITERPLQL